MIEPEFLYIQDVATLLVDLYRYGNATGPRLHTARAFVDVLVVKENGVEQVVANGNGISLSSKFDPTKRNTWKLRRGTALPSGLSLVHDRRPGREDHYMLAPTTKMPLLKYVGLLQELAVRCEKVS